VFEYVKILRNVYSYKKLLNFPVDIQITLPFYRIRTI